MNRLYHTLTVLALLLASVSCTQTEVEAYTGTPYISFWANDNYYKMELQDFNQNFIYEEPDRTRDTLWVKIIARAAVPSKDYHVGIRAYKNTTGYTLNLKEAEAGVQYVPFDSEEMKPLLVIHQGNLLDSIPVILLRDPSLKEEGRKLTLRITDSDEAKAADQLPDDDSNHTYVTIYMADCYTEPANWNYSNLKLGKYGTVKHQFMVEHSDGAHWDYDFIQNLDAADKIYYAYKFKNDLEAYNRTHTEPLREKDGTLVEFPLQ